MKNNSRETNPRRTAAWSAAFALAVTLPAMPGLATASSASPIATTARATVTNTHGPYGEQIRQTQVAQQREAGETNDTRTDLAGLFKVEDAAEAIAEGELTGARGSVGGHQAVVRWPTVRVTLSQNGATTSELANVDRAIATLRDDLRSHADIRRAANEVTGALAPLFTRAGDKVPADVHYLDYLGRSITLDVRGGDWPRARREAKMVKSHWAAVRSRVKVRPAGAAAAAEFDGAARAIMTAVHARNVDATLGAATMTGKAVDTVEKAF